MAVSDPPRPGKKTRRAAAAPRVRSEFASEASPLTSPPATTESTTGEWPPQAELILSALEAGRHGQEERRQTPRVPYRVRGVLRLFSDQPGATGRVIYTRDIHPRGLGFITPQRLALGHGGLLELPGPDGSTITLHCTLLRCREAAPGWYEGTVYFNREHHNLVP